MIRYLGIDYGARRIGVAVGDSVSRIASPLATIEGPQEMADPIAAVLRCAERYPVDAFVVGLPLNMDGSEGPQVAATRKFGDALARRSAKSVHYFDERLSSAAADELLQPGRFSRQKQRARQDRVAAQVILQGFLDAGG